MLGLGDKYDVGLMLLKRGKKTFKYVDTGLAEHASYTRFALTLTKTAKTPNMSLSMRLCSSRLVHSVTQRKYPLQLEIDKN